MQGAVLPACDSMGLRLHGNYDNALALCWKLLVTNVTYESMFDFSLSAPQRQTQLACSKASMVPLPTWLHKLQLCYFGVVVL